MNWQTFGLDGSIFITVITCLLYLPPEEAAAAAAAVRDWFTSRKGCFRVLVLCFWGITRRLRVCYWRAAAAATSQFKQTRLATGAAAGAGERGGGERAGEQLIELLSVTHAGTGLEIYPQGLAVSHGVYPNDLGPGVQSSGLSLRQRLGVVEGANRWHSWFYRGQDAVHGRVLRKTGRLQQQLQQREQQQQHGQHQQQYQQHQQQYQQQDQQHQQQYQQHQQYQQLQQYQYQQQYQQQQQRRPLDPIGRLYWHKHSRSGSFEFPAEAVGYEDLLQDHQLTQQQQQQQQQLEKQQREEQQGGVQGINSLTSDGLSDGLAGAGITAAAAAAAVGLRIASGSKEDGVYGEEVPLLAAAAVGATADTLDGVGAEGRNGLRGQALTRRHDGAARALAISDQISQPPVKTSSSKKGRRGGSCSSSSTAAGGVCMWLWLLLLMGYHVLFALRHLMLTPSSSSLPGWTDEGWVACWQSRLVSKEGWMYLVAEEVGGRHHQQQHHRQQYHQQEQQGQGQLLGGGAGAGVATNATATAGKEGGGGGGGRLAGTLESGEGGGGAVGVSMRGAGTGRSGRGGRGAEAAGGDGGVGGWIRGGWLGGRHRRSLTQITSAGEDNGQLGSLKQEQQQQQQGETGWEKQQQGEAGGNKPQQQQQQQEQRETGGNKVQQQQQGTGGNKLLLQHQVQGEIHDLVPDTDGLLLDQQVARIMLQPSALLSYCRRLQQLFGAAGRPLASIRVISCYSLNGHEYKALYDDTVNLLGYLEEYDSFSLESAVSKWVHDWDTAPRCDRYAPPRSRYGMVRRSRGALVHLQAEAGLRYHVLHDGVSSGLHRRVCHVKNRGKGRGGVERGFAAGKGLGGASGVRTAAAGGGGGGSLKSTATGFRSDRLHESNLPALEQNSTAANPRLGQWGFSRVHLPWGWGFRCQDGEADEEVGDKDGFEPRSTNALAADIAAGQGHRHGVIGSRSSSTSGKSSSRSGCQHHALPLMMRMGHNSTWREGRAGVGPGFKNVCGPHGQFAYMWMGGLVEGN